MSSAASHFMERVKTGVDSAVDMTRLSKWLETNTMDPKIQGKNWGFTDHEFQKALVNEDAPHVVCRKCSQVGVSELTLRIVLGLVRILSQHTAIYTLPTSGFASKFVKSRIDPVIASSRSLREALDPNIDNVELKKLGDSFLYILGTFTQSGAISIPADILVHDEVDFSDQKAMTTFSSRLGHADNGGIKREFSTPTVNGFGISKTFEKSTQNFYGVICDSCHDTVFPNFLEDVVINGYQDSLDDIDKEDLDNSNYDIAGAWLKCPKCNNQITPANLADPEKRRWVPKFPDRMIHGYQVFPYDVIKYNPLAKTLRHLADYDRKADWVNFKVGLPDEDAANSFLKDVMQNSTIHNPILPRDNADSGTCMGIDIGKTSWIIIGKKVDRKLRVIYLERVKQTYENAVLLRAKELGKQFGVIKGVMDAGPEFTTSAAFVSSSWSGRYWANYYVRNKTTSSLSHISLNEEEGIVNTARSISFDLLVKLVNSGRVQFARGDETNLLHAHLRNMKRVVGFNNQGDQVVNWVNTGDDHYAHALNYLNIAATLLESGYKGKTVGCLPMMSKTKFKTHDNFTKVGL